MLAEGRGCPCTDDEEYFKSSHFRDDALFLLKTLHCVKHIINEDECRSVGKAGLWWAHELPVVIVVKGAVQETLGVLEEYKGDYWYDRVAKRIKMLSELYQEKLVTEDEVGRMKGEGGYLPARVVLVQCTKPAEVIARAVNVLDKYGHNKEARQLGALNELFTRHLLTAEEFSEVARKKSWEWEDHLHQVLSTKPAEVVQEACQVLEKHGCSVKELKILNELFTRHLLTAEECSEVAGTVQWEDYLNQALSSKPAEIVQEACQVLEKHGCRVEELKMLSELYQEKLVTEDEVEKMKGEGESLSVRVVFVQFTKPPEVVARTTNVLDKYGHYVEARQLRALNELFTRHLLTAKECYEVARWGMWVWEDHLAPVLLTKPAEVVEEACQVLEKHGYQVEEELKKSVQKVRETIHAEEWGGHTTVCHLSQCHNHPAQEEAKSLGRWLS